MKKHIYLLITIALLLCGTSLKGQGNGAKLKQDAARFLEQKEYTKARYNYLLAYEAYANAKQYDEAVACGIQVSKLYLRENFYKESFEILRAADQLLNAAERDDKKILPMPRYGITKQRMQMYINLKNEQRAKEQLTRLAETARQAANDSLDNDLLYTQATFHYTFGQQAQGDAAFGRLVQQYKEQKAYDKASECYRTLIGLARKAGNAAMVARTYENYIAWTDSVKALTAQDELGALQQRYEASLQTIEEKESSLRTRQYTIIILCVLAAALAGVLVVGAVILLRYILLTRRQKKLIATAHEHNELKTHFIQNISAQMEPTLQGLDATQPGVKALHGFAAHIQEMAALESSLTELYETEEKNVATLCEEVMNQIREKVKADVTLTVNAPKLSVKVSPEPLRHVLLHLLLNAAYYTPEGGKIWLDFKKRGAHTHQFVISDTGCGIDEAQREHLFKPFSEVKDLTEGDGLGLPICSLIATKMNGSLTLDTAYTKGARFVLELHA